MALARRPFCWLLFREKKGSSSEAVFSQPVAFSQGAAAAVSHTETTVQASDVSQNVMSRAPGKGPLSSASASAGQGASVGQEQDVGVMSRVQTQGKASDGDKHQGLQFSLEMVDGFDKTFAGGYRQNSVHV